MGLAAYGNPEVFRRNFQSILRVDEENYGGSPGVYRLSIGQVRQNGSLVRSAAGRGC